MTALHRYEPWLVLLAGPPLVLREWFPWPVQVAALAWIGVLWAARRLATGRWSHRTVLDAPILALLVTVPGAVGAAVDADAGLSRALSLGFAVALYYAVANAMTTPARVWSAATWLMVAGLGLGAVGLVSVSWLEKFPALTPVLSRLPRLVTALPHPTLASAGVHPNTLGALLAIFVPLAIACAFWPAGEDAGDGLDERPRWIRPVAVASLAALLPLLALTQSRGAWLGLAGALVLFGAVRSTTVRLLVAAGALAAVLMALGLGQEVLSSLTVCAPSAPQGAPNFWLFAGGRLDLWCQVIGLVGEHPLTGVGLNNFILVHGQRPEYGGFYVYQGAPHAHNTLLQSAVDYGLPGLVAVAGMYAALAWAARRAHQRLAGHALDAVALGATFGLVVYALHGLVDTVAIGAKPGFVVWAFAGVLAGIRAHAHRWTPDAPRATPERGIVS